MSIDPEIRTKLHLLAQIGLVFFLSACFNSKSDQETAELKDQLQRIQTKIEALEQKDKVREEGGESLKVKSLVVSEGGSGEIKILPMGIFSSATDPSQISTLTAKGLTFYYAGSPNAMEAGLGIFYDSTKKIMYVSMNVKNGEHYAEIRSPYATAPEDLGPSLVIASPTGKSLINTLITPGNLWLEKDNNDMASLQVTDIGGRLGIKDQFGLEHASVGIASYGESHRDLDGAMILSRTKSEGQMISGKNGIHQIIGEPGEGQPTN